MRCEPGDFLLVAVEAKKFLARAKKVKNSSVLVELNGKHLADESTKRGSTIKIDPGNIMLNFGKTVPEGKTVLGVRLEPWYRAVHIKRWGRMHVMRFSSEEDVNKVVDAFTRCMKWIRKSGLDHKLPIDIEFLPGRPGIMAGKYIHDSKAERDTMQLFMDDLIDLEFLINHETGHHLWIHFLDDEWRLKWVTAYHNSVQIENVEPTKIKNLRKDLVTAGNVKDFNKTLEDADKPIFKEILRQIRQVHHLNSEHIQIMLNQQDDLRAIWPKRDLDISDVGMFVSKYARKSPEEMFCESLAHYLADREMHKTIRKLIKQTLEHLEAENLATREAA